MYQGQGKPVSLARIGTGYSQIAVSADGTYVAALRGGTLYAGLVGGPLTKRGTGFASVSWDVDDDLWAAQNGQVVMFRGTQNVRQPLAQMVSVAVNPPASAPVTGPFTALQVAPDGVRVALVMDGNELIFGAISGSRRRVRGITLSLVQETVPVGTNFTALTWYGPDDVIALAGDAVTDYPVSGGTATSIQADPGMQTITASCKQPLIAGCRGARWPPTPASPAPGCPSPATPRQPPASRQSIQGDANPGGQENLPRKSSYKSVMFRFGPKVQPDIWPRKS